MDQMHVTSGDQNPGFHLKGLCKIGGIVALIAGLLFRRNIAAEVSLFAGSTPPANVNDWFTLLQNNRLLGLIHLDIFNIVNYLLVGLVFITLYFIIKPSNRVLAAFGTACGLVGISVYFATNTALSMLTLSSQYALSAAQPQRELLLAAGQSMLSIMHFGTGGWVSMLLVAAAGLLYSIALVRSKILGTAVGVVGIVTVAFDLIYCVAFAFVPPASHEILAVCLIPAAGLMLMIWHVMIGVKVLRFGRGKVGGAAA